MWVKIIQNKNKNFRSGFLRFIQKIQGRKIKIQEYPEKSNLGLNLLAWS